jgi:hypothetical protein
LGKREGEVEAGPFIPCLFLCGEGHECTALLDGLLCAGCADGLLDAEEFHGALFGGVFWAGRLLAGNRFLTGLPADGLCCGSGYVLLPFSACSFRTHRSSLDFRSGLPDLAIGLTASR